MAQTKVQTQAESWQQQKVRRQQEQQEALAAQIAEKQRLQVSE